MSKAQNQGNTIFSESKADAMPMPSGKGRIS
jgi:hypothetical protein